VPALDPVQLLQALIRFESVNPPGREGPLIAHLAELLRAQGVESQLLAADEARPNLLARVEGRGEAPPLLLFGHVDVVPAGDEPWSQPPFSGALVDGEVWGRGALDMKSGVAMLVSAFLDAAAAGAPGDLLLALTVDEERGSEAGARFLVERHPERFSGVRHAVSEFGGPCRHLGGRRLYPIQVAEKRICRIRAVAAGRAGHAATPPRRSAAGALARFLVRLERRGLPVEITPVARAMLEALAAAAPAPQRLALAALARPRLAGAALRALGPAARPLAPILRDTAAPVSVRAGKGGNVVPAHAGADLDVRVLPGRSTAEVLEELRALAPAAVSFEVLLDEPRLPPTGDLTLLPRLAAVLSEIDPGAGAFPLLLPGATDARFFARLGIQTYGFLPLRVPPHITSDLIHAADERVTADGVRFGSQALGRAVLGYAG
jgi:acetylornithine deacetylase/succinyl-diaminopimelate desuccinylase-like protein